MKKFTAIVKASGDAISSGLSTAATAAQNTVIAAKEVSEKAGQVTVALGKSTGQALSSAADKTGKIVGAATVLLGDLNGDGKIDFEDAKIAADRITQGVKDFALTDLGKDVVPLAIVGAAIAVPVPVIGPVMGATAGAALGVYKHLMK